MKRVFHSYLWKMPHSKLQEHVEGFINEWLPKLPYPEILKEIAYYKKQGNPLILSSASPELWVQRIGLKLGFDQSYGTLFSWTEKTSLFPEIIGENHKGREKVLRLKEVGITNGLEGFTDSKADLPLLYLCKEKTLVNPLPKIRKIGEQNNWRILEPDKPWKNRLSFGIGCIRQLFGFWKP
jgi:phosphatidylglycerophosphatase C